MYHNKNSNSRIKVGKNLLVWGFVLFLMAAIAVGDIEQVSGEAVAGKSVEATEFDVSGGGADTSAGERIQFKCREEEGFGVRDALAMLGSMCQKNIVPTPNVDGPLAFRHLSDVTFEEAMDAILGESFVYKQKGNLIWVYTKEEYKKIREDKDRMICKVFTLYYITAEEAGKLVKPVLSSTGKIEFSTAAEKDISGGSGGSAGAGGSLGSGGGGDSMALHDTVVVYDYPENIAKAEKVITALDIRPKQVLVEATILSALLTENMKVGIDWNLLQGVHLDGTEAKTAVYSETTGTTISAAVAEQNPLEQIAAKVVGDAVETAGFASTGYGGLRIGITSGDLASLITALETVTDITVLANPKILALNKQEGSVLIGRKLGYRESTSVTAAGTETKGAVKFLPTGTQLVFRPYIGNDGYIRMDIYPKDSTADTDADGVPQETTTELKTNILVKDGETIVIGGLFRDAITSSKSQVPFLGDLPLIGAAFRSVSDTSVRQEVIVLLTPHIIKEPEQTDGEARAADVSRKRIGAREGLQWVTRSRLAEDSYAKAVEYYLEGKKKAALNKLNWALATRPTYLEALRLKERIISETDPKAETKIERKIIDIVEQEDVEKWLRR